MSGVQRNLAYSTASDTSVIYSPVAHHWVVRNTSDGLNALARHDRVNFIKLKGLPKFNARTT
jgi:hypothetical protein